MKLLIYTQEETRKNLLMSTLNKTRKNTSVNLEFITNLSTLADTLIKDEADIIGGIFDFENEPLDKIRYFSYKVMNVTNNIIPLLFLNKEFDICSTKLYLVPFLRNNPYPCESIDELISRLPLFLKRCENIIK